MSRVNNQLPNAYYFRYNTSALLDFLFFFFFVTCPKHIAVTNLYDSKLEFYQLRTAMWGTENFFYTGNSEDSCKTVDVATFRDMGWLSTDVTVVICGKYKNLNKNTKI